MGRRFRDADFVRQVREHRDVLLAGRFVCVDPATGATSAVGWAEFVAGKFRRGGAIQPPKGLGLVARMRWIMERLIELDLVGVDVVILERLRGRMVHPHLHWATGVLLVALAPETYLEIPIQTWKAAVAADPDYAKGDAADARAFGTAAVNLARGLDPSGRPVAIVGRKRPDRNRATRTSRVRTTTRGRP